MAPPRLRPEVVGSTKAVTALCALARLLASQAAREAVATFSKAAAPGTEAVTGATIATDTPTAASWRWTEKAMGQVIKEFSSPRLLTIEEVAKICGVSSRSVRRWIDRDELPAVRIGRLVRVTECDLQRFFDRHRTCD